MRSRFEHPAWALLLAAAPLAFGLFRGPALIDDAFITFRYAENLARGRGFVFDVEPLLGATAPLYCLLLAGLRVIGIAPTVSSFGIGVAAAAATPVLLWKIGVAAGRPVAGLLGGLLLGLMPDWWLNSKTGMETTLTGMFLALTVLFDLRGKAVAGGLSAAALVLTRPDAAVLPVLLVVKHLFVDRSPARAARFAAAAFAGVLPWLLYAAVTFGTPLPQSLAAKRLIHPLPWTEALGRNFGWLTGAGDRSAGMLLVFTLWLIGVAAAARAWRAGLPFLIWPAVSLAGLSFLQIGPFFWYRIPLLPALGFGAAFGFETLRDLAAGAGLRRVAAAACLLPVAIVGSLMATGGSWLWNPRNLLSFHAKETAMADMAREIRERSRALGRDPASLTVYVGEVGVLAYDLLEARVIDSSGINSREVFDLRKRDQERLRRADPGRPWFDHREQSPEWSREVIRIFRPDFIASDERYLHLPQLSRDPAFRALYRPVQRWTFPNGVSLVLLQREDMATDAPKRDAGLPGDRLLGQRHWRS
jgi:hypothetical protein